MLHRELNAIEEWFWQYAGAFSFDDPAHRANIELKLRHTRRVASNMDELSARAAPDRDPLLARAIAVLHDVGRFPQYHRYRTFRDAGSVNHGELGAEVMAGSGVLKGIAAHEARIILECLRYHNAFSLPRSGVTERTYLMLLRDADKLDIWRVFADNHELPRGERASALGQGLDEAGTCSAQAVERLSLGRVVPASMLKTHNDMKLMQLSWAYDLNFPASCSMALAKGDLMRIASSLPPATETEEAVERAFMHLRQRGEKA